MPNRLINETSPYLLQHARNPVDWYAWGEEAFAEARRRDVPIFLSIGYSTCYWCHVMERESFEDAATAAVMNERFVCVKVDREERPDVDDVYMAATQLMTGSGGWPMNSFLDPHTLKPFWCGTYFPPEPMHGRPSFTQVLMGMSDVWASKRDEVTEQADNLAAAVRDHLAGDAQPAALGAGQVTAAVTTLLQIFDRTEGGFGGAPKFPQPVYTRFLLDARPIVDDETRAAIDHAVRLTLDRMAVGGLFDQAGGGFHRYCVDGTWTVPHFEKMLYDNAQLLPLYARASVLYGDAFYREIAERTFAYIRREMTGPRGGFYSAQDAEVDGREGLNYLWTAEQIGAVLGGEDAAFANAVYGVADGANFRDPHHPGDEPSNVLRLEGRPASVAERLGMSLDAFGETRVRVDAALLAARDRREQPGLDDKVLTAWNGMMIVGLAEAAAALDDRSMLDAAERAGEFLVGTMRAPDGRLHRSFRATDRDAGGRARHDGVLEDHAWAVLALLALDGAGRAGGGDGYKAIAVEIAGAIHRDFADGSGFYTDVAGGRGDLFVRPRSTYDGATPSGTGVAIDALLALDRADPGGPWADRAVEQLRGVSRDVAERPVSAVNAVRSVIAVLAVEGGADRLAFGEAVTPADGRVDAAGSASVVEIFADRESIALSGDDPATLTLGFRIKPGYHILSADPVVPGGDAIDGLIPLRVGLVSGGGVAVYAEYPDGEPYGEAIVGSDDLRVHSGELRLRVVIERREGVGAGPGEPVLGVTFQACDDAACLKPSTVRIGVRIDVE